MSYVWKDGDTITAAGLNASQLTFVNGNISTGDATTNPEGALSLDNNGDLYQSTSGKQALLVSLKGLKGDTGDAGPAGAVGPAGAAGAKGDTGDAGKDGLGVKSLALTKDANGQVNGGTVTFTDNTTAAVTVTTAK